MLDDDTRRARECEVPWNELRQAGVFRRIERARSSPRTPPRRAPLLLVVAALVLVAGFALSRTRALPIAAPAGEHPSVVGAASSQLVGETLLRLADGSVARQMDGAHVELQAADEARTEVLQTQGTVSYEVVRNPARRFVVRVRDVNVSVLGTLFRVEVQARSVAVYVERGQVEVAQQERRVRLNAGEGITLETSEAVPDKAAQSTPPSTLPAPETAAPPASDSPSAARSPRVESPVQLLDRADRARARGDLDQASTALHELLQQYPNDSRVALAEFMLGSVESARGSHGDAARAYQACLARGAAGALGEDALAAWAKAQALSSDKGGAVSTAQRYLAAYPSGVHRRAMQRLVDGDH
jgi:TolA-binding protein